MSDQPAHGGYPGKVVVESAHERPRRFRTVTKPVEAMRLLPGTDNYKDVCDWLHGRGVDVNHNGEGLVRWRTETGNIAAAGPGDWVVCSDGKFFCLGDHTFRLTHDEVRDLLPVSHPHLDRSPRTLGDAMRLIGSYTESEGGDSDDTRQARANLFDAYEAWCQAGRPEGDPVSTPPPPVESLTHLRRQDHDSCSICDLPWPCPDVEERWRGTAIGLRNGPG